MPVQTVLDAMYANLPLVFGHRGARAYAPMNTIPSFELAADQGAHGIELDVQRSKDGYPVIVHDFTVDNTTNGSGRVTDLTLTELKALDAGSWFAPKFAGVPIPTLDEVFESVGKRLFVNVEIKSDSAETDGVEQVVADCISRHLMHERVLISSFNPYTLTRFRAIMPDIPIGYLYEKPWTGLPIDAPYEAFNPHYTQVSEDLVDVCRERNILINAWTVNDPQRALELWQLGVAGIITDNPDLVLAKLNESFVS